MRPIVIIPARGGSKRLPGKNLKMLNGHSLLAHSIIYAVKHLDIIEDIYVTTEAVEIKCEAIEYGAKVISRPVYLATDEASTVEVLQHAILSLGIVDTDIILLQPTNPLRPENLLRSAIELYNSHTYDSLFTISKSGQKYGRIENNKFEPVNYEMGQRSQDMESLYYENGLLYISKSSLITSGKIVGENHVPYITDHIYATVDIDTAADLDNAAYVMSLNEKIKSS